MQLSTILFLSLDLSLLIRWFSSSSFFIRRSFARFLSEALVSSASLAFMVLRASSNSCFRDWIRIFLSCRMRPLVILSSSLLSSLQEKMHVILQSSERCRIDVMSCSRNSAQNKTSLRELSVMVISIDSCMYFRLKDYKNKSD